MLKFKGLPVAKFKSTVDFCRGLKAKKSSTGWLLFLLVGNNGRFQCARRLEQALDFIAKIISRGGA